MGMRGGDALAKTAAVQQFSRLEKAGGRVEPLGCTPQKNHPQKDAISIRQPACTKKREMVLHFRSKTSVKTISSSRPFLPASAPDHCRYPALSSVYVYLLSELQRASYSSSYREPKCMQVDAGVTPG